MNDLSATWGAVVLAAGRGKRMRSALPKVLHPMAGRPMLGHVVGAARGAGISSCTVVVGKPGDAIAAAVGEPVSIVTQDQPLGTGHAVTQAREAVGDAEQVLVLNGDVPLVTAQTLIHLMKIHEGEDADVTFLTAEVADAEEYGVIERDRNGAVVALIEAADRATAIEGPAEINSGQYCFRASWLWPRLETLPKSASGEFYLTTLVMTAVAEGATLRAVRALDGDEVRGVNDRIQLAEAEAALRRRINRKHMAAGVTIVDPASTYIDTDVSIGIDSVIEPNTRLLGSTTIGSECHIGPDATLRNASLASRCQVVSSIVEDSTLEDGVDVGPYSHVRPGVILGAGTHIGNYAEVKSARLGRGVKMGHFSYVGDADVGDGTNIGAGTITCNYDGTTKHRTVIGKGVFLGSDTKLVAPITVGDGARTGAGSVVTKDVPAGALAVGAPARIMRSNQS